MRADLGTLLVRRLAPAALALSLGACDWFTDFKDQPRIEPWESYALADSAGNIDTTVSRRIPFRGQPQQSVPVTGSVIFYRFAFDPADLDHAVAGMTTSGAYVTRDGGRSWNRSEGLGSGWVNAFNGVISPVDGEVVWFMALSESLGRQIFRSTDGGATFTPIDGADFNSPNDNFSDLVVDPSDPSGQRLYAASEGVGGPDGRAGRAGGGDQPRRQGTRPVR